MKTRTRRKDYDCGFWDALKRKPIGNLYFKVYRSADYNRLHLYQQSYIQGYKKGRFTLLGLILLSIFGCLLAIAFLIDPSLFVGR